MGKIDKINKEIDIITSLLFAMIAIFISVIIGLIARYDNQRIDIIFWIGVLLEPVIMLIAFKMTKILVKKVKELEEL